MGLLFVVAAMGALTGQTSCTQSDDTGRPYLMPSSGTGARTGATFDAGVMGAPPTIEIRAPAADELLPVTSAPEVRARIVDVGRKYL